MIDIYLDHETTTSALSTLSVCSNSNTFENAISGCTIGTTSTPKATTPLHTSKTSNPTLGNIANTPP